MSKEKINTETGLSIFHRWYRGIIYRKDIVELRFLYDVVKNDKAVVADIDYLLSEVIPE